MKSILFFLLALLTINFYSQNSKMNNTTVYEKKN